MIALYRKLDLPVLPVVINAGCFWGRGPKRGGTIVVSYFPPIPPGLAPAEVMTRVEQLLNTEKGRLVPAKT